MIYPAAEFQRIHREGFECALPVEALEAIQRLAATVGAETYCPTPVFPKRQKPAHEKVGDAKRLAEFQSHLNKLSDDTYVSLEPKLTAVLVGLESDNLATAAATLLTVAFANPFFAALYARLFTKCAATWPEFKRQFDAEFVEYERALLRGETNLRAKTKFILHLRGWLPKATTVDLLDKCQRLVEENLRCPEKSVETEEWAEHVFILAAGGVRVDRARLKAVSSQKPGGGISLKVLFRYMDLMDQL